MDAIARTEERPDALLAEIERAGRVPVGAAVDDRAMLALRFAGQPAARMKSRYDVVVIGGGHNGLVAASYLARAGRSVLVSSGPSRWAA